MKNILMLELYSSGINYVNDIIDRGYKPVVFYFDPEKYPTSPTLRAYKNVQLYKNKIKAYKIDNNYNKTLKLAKKINPLGVVHCSDSCTILHDKLSHDLKLPNNPLKYIDCYIDKFKMQDALRKYGIRYIKSKVIHNVEEGIKFYEEENLKTCVIKQVCGSASKGLHICKNKDTLIKYLKNEFNNTNFFTEEKCNDLLIQEKIDGTEYIVNTLSKNGKHILLSF